MKPNSELRQRIVRHWPLYAIIALPTAFLLVFSYWPMVGVQIAFRNFNPVQGIWGVPGSAFSSSSCFSRHRISGRWSRIRWS